MTTEELRENLLAAPKNGYTRITAEERAQMEAYIKRYVSFIDTCKIPPFCSRSNVILFALTCGASYTKVVYERPKPNG